LRLQQQKEPRVKTAPSRLASLLALACTVTAPATVVAAAANPTEQPAAWIPHHVMVVYRNLPRAYTCDELWYKVGDLLRALGAWASVSITPYDCKPSTATDGRSPQLEVRFLTLRALDPQNARWAEAKASTETVVLKPGHPKSLTSADCELLAQTQEGLLSLVSNLHVEGEALRCEGSATKPYALSIQTLVATQAH
jgi:hypothetical protein